jgi:hypothetical protein
MLAEVDAQGEPTGREWWYGHIDPSTIPEAVRAAAYDGSVIPAGTELGALSHWHQDERDIADGEPYHHLHLDLRSSARDDDPALVLDLPDHLPPTIEKIHFLPDDGLDALTGEVPVLSGKVDVLAEAYDWMPSYQVDGSGRPTPGEPSPFPIGVSGGGIAIAPVGGGDPVHVAELPPDMIWDLTDLYLPAFRIDGKPQLGRQDRFGHRTFLTNVVDGRGSGAGSWDTTQVPNGDYVVKVIVCDDLGNEATVERTVRVQNP